MLDISTTNEQLYALVASWKEHPVSSALLSTCKDLLQDNIHTTLIDGVNNVEFSSGRLQGQNQILHKLLNLYDWMKDELEYKKNEVSSDE